MTLSFVGSVQNHTSSGAGPLVLNYNTAGGGTTAHNCLVACIQAWATSPGATVSGITFNGTSADNWQDTGVGVPGASIWIDPDCAGGQGQIVISAGTAGGSDLQINGFVMEFSGILAASPLDRGFADSTTGDFDSGFTILTRQAREIYVGIGSGEGAAAFTIAGPSSPWVNLGAISNSLGGTFTRAIAGYQIASDINNAEYNGTFSPSAGQPGAGAVITLLAAPAIRPAVLRTDPQAVRRSRLW